MFRLLLRALLAMATTCALEEGAKNSSPPPISQAIISISVSGAPFPPYYLLVEHKGIELLVFRHHLNVAKTHTDSRSSCSIHSLRIDEDKMEEPVISQRSRTVKFAYSTGHNTNNDNNDILNNTHHEMPFSNSAKERNRNRMKRMQENIVDEMNQTNQNIVKVQFETAVTKKTKNTKRMKKKYDIIISDECITFLVILLSHNMLIGLFNAISIFVLVIGVVRNYCYIKKNNNNNNNNNNKKSMIPYHRRVLFLLYIVGLVQIADAQDYSHICQTPNNYVPSVELNRGGQTKTCDAWVESFVGVSAPFDGLDFSQTFSCSSATDQQKS